MDTTQNEEPDCEREEERKTERVFAALGKEFDATITTHSEESLWSQYLALEVYPEATRIFTHFHAGPGQLVAGDAPGRRADATVVLEGGKRIVFCQYHGEGHYDGHADGCPLQRRLPGCTGGHGGDGPRRWGQRDEEGEFRATAKTEEGDALLRAYAEAMTAAADTGARFEVRIDLACDLFHRRRRRGGKGEEAKKRESLSERLRRLYPSGSLTGDPFGRKGGGKTITESALLKELLTNDQYQGFVTLVGGRENRDDIASLTSGFCLVKNTPKASDLGLFTKISAGIEAGCQTEEASERVLEERCEERRLTTTKRSFEAGTGHTMTVQTLRFLFQHRKLRQFRLLHAMLFELRPYLRDFIDPILRRRARLKREGGAGGLEEKSCKLILNGLYGYYFLQSTSYSNTRIYASTRRLRQGLANIARKGYKPPARPQSIVLLGSVKARAGAPNLVYAVTRKNEDTTIENQVQLAANILSCSKLNIFSHLLFLLSALDPALAEYCYTDTDSIMIFCARDTLDECVKKDMLGTWQKWSPLFFEGATTVADEPQSGCLEIEGVFRGGYIRTLKCYRLMPLDPESGDVRRFRSIPMREARQLPRSCFEILPAPGEKEQICSTLMLGPTKSLEMVLKTSNRALGTRVNYKRCTLVSKTSCIPTCRALRLILLLPPQGPHHTLPLP